MFIRFWDLLIIEQIFLSTQVKQSVINTVIIIWYLRNPERFKTFLKGLRKLGNIRNISKLYRIIA